MAPPDAGPVAAPAASGDLYPLDILAFSLGLLRGLLAQDPIGLEVREIVAQPAVSEVANRRVGAVIAVQALEHILVARDGRALEPLLTLTLGEPSLGGLTQGAVALLSVFCWDLGFQVAQDPRETRLGVLRRQMLRCRARPIPRAPDSGSTGRPST